MEERVEAEGQAEAEAERPWQGLPEAELTQAQRDQAARLLAEEEALRKARGD